MACKDCLHLTWEYDIIHCSFNDSIKGRLNELGKQGWELASADINYDRKSTALIIKRPIFL